MSAAQVYEQMSEPAEAVSEQLLLEQLPQVKYIARRIHERLPQHVPFDDLLHAGIVGLIDAMHKFDRQQECALRLVRQVPHSRGDPRQPARHGLEPARPAPQGAPPGSRHAEAANRAGTLGHRARAGAGHGHDAWKNFSTCWTRFAASRSAACRSSRWKTDGRPISAKPLPGRLTRTRCRCTCRAKRKQMLAAAIARIAGAGAAGAGAVLPGGAHDEGSGRGAGSGRVAGFADPFRGSGPAARGAGECRARSRRTAGIGKVRSHGKGLNSGRDRRSIPRCRGATRRGTSWPEPARWSSPGTCIRRACWARSSCKASASCTRVLRAI